VLGGAPAFRPDGKRHRLAALQGSGAFAFPKNNCCLFPKLSVINRLSKVPAGGVKCEVAGIFQNSLFQQVLGRVSAFGNYIDYERNAS
jgi:hypothetical protein